MLPDFEVVHRTRPVRLVGEERADGFAAPYAAVEVDLPGTEVPGRVTAGFTGPDGLRPLGWYDGGLRVAGLDVTDDSGRSTHHRSRRHGRPDSPPEAVATTLTGTRLTVFTRSGGVWTGRGRVDLPEPPAPDALRATTGWQSHDPDGPPPLGEVRSGTSGQLGLRDLRFATHADGRPVERDGWLFLTSSTRARWSCRLPTCPPAAWECGTRTSRWSTATGTSRS